LVLTIGPYLFCSNNNFPSIIQKTFEDYDKFHTLSKLASDALNSQDVATIEDTLLRLLEAIDKPSASMEYQLAAQDAYEAIDGHLSHIS